MKSSYAGTWPPAPFITAPWNPMLAMWCCPHEFGHPLALMCIALTNSSEVLIESRASPRALFKPIDDVIPSLHESVPGQVTMSRIVSLPGAAKSSSFSAR